MENRVLLLERDSQRAKFWRALRSISSEPAGETYKQVDRWLTQKVLHRHTLVVRFGLVYERVRLEWAGAFSPSFPSIMPSITTEWPIPKHLVLVALARDVALAFRRSRLAVIRAEHAMRGCTLPEIYTPDGQHTEEGLRWMGVQFGPQVAHGLDRNPDLSRPLELLHPDMALHGWQFCYVYHALVRYALGKEAGGQLRAAFRREGVRHRPKKWGSPTPAQLKALQRARITRHPELIAKRWHEAKQPRRRVDI